MSDSPTLESGDYVTPTVKLVRPLAEGGMGRVWVAEHEGLHTQVVVKTMSAAMAERPDGAERFAREAAIAAAIKSPHVVQVFDHGVTEKGVPYIVMELLEGKDLGALLEQYGRMDPADVVTVVVQMGKALTRAHRAGIVHRDIKPENIFLAETGEHRGVTQGLSGFRLAPDTFVKLLDFGTARREEGVARTTAPGQIMGTPYYMSPEQSVGSELDERSDIWSLGVVVYEALTGRKAFDGPSIGAITIAIHGKVPSIVEHVPELSPEVDAWFQKACAQAPEDRFASAREATRAFVEAITGNAMNDMPTESVFAPPVRPFDETPRVRGDSTPASALSRTTSRGPLSDSLAPRPGERKGTTIAAGAVMAVAALAMLAIVVRGRQDAPPPPPATTTQATMPAAPALPAPATAVAAPGVGVGAGPGVGAAAEPAEPAAEASPKGAARATAASKPSAPAAVAKAAKATAAKPSAVRAGAAAKADGAGKPDGAAKADAAGKPEGAAKADGAGKPEGAAKAEGDDDLVRLQKAAARHAEPEPPAIPTVAPTAPPAETPPPLPAP